MLFQYDFVWHAYLFTAVVPMFQELISFWFIDLQNAIL